MFLCVICLFFFAPQDDDLAVLPLVDAQFVIDVIDAREKQVRSVSWRVSERQGDLLIQDPPQIVNESPARLDGTVLVDCESRRYLAELDSVHLVVGKETLLKNKEAAAFDSEVHRRWKQSGEFVQGSDADLIYGEGSIDNDDERMAEELGDSGLLNQFADSLGMNWMPPNFTAEVGSRLISRGVADFLRSRVEKGVEVRVVERDREWLITTKLDTPPDLYPETLRVTWSRDQQAIVCQEWLYVLPEGEELLKRATIQNQKVSDLWVPAVVFLEQHNKKIKRAYRWEFTDVELNRSLTTSDFVLSFPNDIQLTDYINGMHYLTGGSAVDEQRAVREFMTRTGNRGVGASPPQPRRSVLLWLNFAVISILLAVALWRRWGKTACVLPFLLVHPSAEAQSSPVLSHSVGERVRVSKCGYRVAVAAFEYFDVSYQPELLDASLPSSWDGVRLSDIANVAQAYGLSIDIRKNVARDDLPGAVNKEVVAIVPVQLRNGWNHYYLVVGDGSRTLVLDPSKGIYPLAEAIGPDALQPTGGAVLFIGRSADLSVVHSVKLDQDSVDFGEFYIGGGQPLVRKLKLTNSADRAVLVSKILTSCGCARVKWRGGVVGPHQSVPIELELNPSAWGKGKHRKQIQFELGNGQKGPVLDVLGVGLTLSAVYGVELSPSRLNVVEGVANDPVIKLTGAMRTLDLLHAVPLDDWLTLTVDNNGKNELLLKLDIDFDTVPQRHRATGKASTVIRVEHPGINDPLQIPIEVVLASPVRFDSIQKTISNGKVASFRAKSTEAIDSIRVEVTPDGLVADSKRTEAGWIITATSDEGRPADRDVFVLKCRVSFKSGRKDTRNLVVRIDR